MGKSTAAVLGFLGGMLTAAMGDSSSVDALLEQVEELRNSGSYEEARILVDAVIRDASEQGDIPRMAEGLYQLALVHYFLNEYEEARATLEIGRTQANLNQLTSLEADFLSAEGVLEWKLGNLAQAVPKLEAALEIQKAAGEWINMSSISNNLGIIAYSLKDYPAAVGHYRQGLEWLGDRENNRLRASLYSNLAEVLIPMGQFDEAESRLYAALAIEEEAHEPRSIAYTYFNLGELYAGKGDSEKALSHYRKALDIQITLEDDWATALTRLKYGSELWLNGNQKEAFSQIRTGFESAKELNALSLLRDYCAQLAGMSEKAGKSGLADYYAGLQAHFSRQVEQTETPSRPAPDGTEGAAGEAKAGSRLLESPLQAVTILVLCLLITVLVLENTRLRKRMREL